MSLARKQNPVPSHCRLKPAKIRTTHILFIWNFQPTVDQEFNQLLRLCNRSFIKTLDSESFQVGQCIHVPGKQCTQTPRGRSSCMRDPSRLRPTYPSSWLFKFILYNQPVTVKHFMEFMSCPNKVSNISGSEVGTPHFCNQVDNLGTWYLWLATEMWAFLWN